MKPEDVYIQQVLSHILRGPVRDQIEAEIRGHIADRVERGSSVEDAVRQLGDPRALAESYLSAVPMRKPPHVRRLMAKVVDTVLVLLLPCLVFVVWWTTSAHKESPVWIAFAAAYLLTLSISLWYPILAEYLSGQTLGKRMFGLQVVTEKGARIGIGQAIVRYLPVLLQVATVDALFALFTDRRQRAFEMLTKTRVVDVSEASQPSPGTVARAMV
jgi:uncharacterized RDD family membrane protein YckC